MASQAHTFFTPDEYLEMEYHSEEKNEYLDGVIFAMSGASFPHRRIASNIYADLRSQLKGTPCEAQPSDLRVRTADSRMYSYPDVVVFCGGAKLEHKLGDTLLNPVVIFEVLSPSTEAFDRGKKFAGYRKIKSLREYVLVSQDNVLVERYARKSNGDWSFSSLSRLEDSLKLSSIPAALKLASIYESVFPPQ